MLFVSETSTKSLKVVKSKSFMNLYGYVEAEKNFTYCGAEILNINSVR
jgi:hypothetical protein